MVCEYDQIAVIESSAVGDNSAMPTEEYKQLLDRGAAMSRAAPLIDAAAPLLTELVNHASVAFRRCTAASDNLGGENEDLAAFILYRHIIELIDGVDTLFRSSCVDASIAQCDPSNGRPFPARGRSVSLVQPRDQRALAQSRESSRERHRDRRLSL